MKLKRFQKFKPFKRLIEPIELIKLIELIEPLKQKLLVYFRRKMELNIRIVAYLSI